MGQSPSSDTYNRQFDGIPFFQGKAEFGEVFPTVNMYCSRPKKIAKPGATLLSIRAPVGPTNLAPQECCIGRGLAAFHPCGEIEPKFVLYLFRNDQPLISRTGTGSTFQAIGKGFIESMEFNLPPLAEQRRIVAKIEKLFSELDKGIESLKTARRQLEVYRQSVLKHAFEGKLTAQWREQNKTSLRRKNNCAPASSWSGKNTTSGNSRSGSMLSGRGRRLAKQARNPGGLRLSMDQRKRQKLDRKDRKDFLANWASFCIYSLGVVQLGRQRSPKNRSRDHPTKYIRAANITERGLDLGRCP